MKSVAIGAALILTAALVPAGPAHARGCIKGAVVGGVAGHYVGHHGLLGATAGCLIGRHEANKSDRYNGTTSRQYYTGYR